MFKVGIGQDSHRIQDNAGARPLMLAGVRIPADFALLGNSDSDVGLHAVTNAVSGVTGRPILGPVADSLCKAGITDSAIYLMQALQDLDEAGYRLGHISISFECARPKLLPHLPRMRARLAELCGLRPGDVGLTATSGEGLTDFGKGLGIQAMAVVTAYGKQAAAGFQ